MKRFFKATLIAVSVFAGLAGLTTFWAVGQTRHVPEFYTRATSQLPVDLKAASAELEQDVVKLQDAAAQLGSWQALFTEAQINAWLVQQLPAEFPKLLPDGVAAPRIMIEDNRILAAARYKSSRIDTIVSFEIKVALTEHANVLAVRIENLRAGSLPLPLQGFLRGISAEAAKGDFEVKWDFDEKGPVALVNVPSDHPAYEKTPVIIESVKLQAGQLLLAGHTGTQAWQTYRPRSPIYQLASSRSQRNDNCQPPSKSARVR